MPTVSSRAKIILISTLGSLIENYDFAIYGFFAATLTQLFFPKNDPSINMILAYSVFTVGYVVRPLGAIVFGHLGDVLGRKAGLVLSMMCMSIPLWLMVLLPTYERIGLAASLLLIACRLLQGLSVGGEFPAAITFLAEHASPRHRGFFSSFSFMGINIGLLSASAMQVVLSHFLTPAQLTHFGWRIAFAIGAVLAMGSYWIRRQLAETPIFTAQKTQGTLLKYPLFHSVRHEGLSIVRAVFIIAAFTASVPTVLIFMPNYLSDYLHVPLTKALYMNTCNAFIFIVLIPLMGALSDYIGRKAVLMCGSGGFIVLSSPCYHLIQSSSTALMMTGMIGLIVCSALMTGGMVPLLAEFFGNSTRATSVALTYNISVALFGGTSLMIITTLFHLTGQLQAPAWVMMSAGTLSLLSIITLKFSRQKKL